MQTALTINNNPLSIKEYNGQRVVTFKDIDTLHQRPEGTARRNFNENLKRFVKNEDFYKVCAYEIRTRKIMELSPMAREDITLLTESGYLMLVKSFTDDLSWAIQRQLVNCYFRVQQASFTWAETLKSELKEEIKRELCAEFRTQQPSGVFPPPTYSIISFMDTCIQYQDRAVIPARVLYERYVEHCKGLGLPPETQTSFGRKMRAAGLQKKKSGTYYYVNLTLMPEG